MSERQREKERERKSEGVIGILIFGYLSNDCVLHSKIIKERQLFTEIVKKKIRKNRRRARERNRELGKHKDFMKEKEINRK